MEFYAWELVTSKGLHSYRSCEHIQLCASCLNSKTCRDVSNLSGPPFSTSTLPSGIQRRGTGWEPKNRWRRSQVWWIDELLFIWLQHFTVNTTEFQVFGWWMRFSICANCCTFSYMLMFNCTKPSSLWLFWSCARASHLVRVFQMVCVNSSNHKAYTKGYPRYSKVKSIWHVIYRWVQLAVGFETLMDPILLCFFPTG